MNIEIKPIPESLYRESLALSAFAFQYELTPEDIEKRLTQMSGDSMWGAFVDGQLASKLTILQLETWIQGKQMAMGGIASVATWPEFRRGGLVSRLLGQALQSMRDSGQTVSFLYPFSFGFYRKYGWETFADYKKYEIPADLLPKLRPQPGRIVRLTEELAEALDPIYSSFASRYNGTLVRTEAWWKRSILDRKTGTAAVYYDEDGNAKGYVFYQVKEKECTVHELVWLDHQARLALWRFLADHDSMIEKVVLRAPADDKLPFLLDNPRIKQEIVPYFMARIVDAAAFIAEYPFVSGTESTLKLELSDPYAPWNNGRFVVTIDESGTARVETEEEATSDVPVVRCSIQTLSTLLMGYQRAGFLHEIGRLETDEAGVDALERLIPARTTYLPDFF
ncbi:GNAT family N-acetyltransferase [Paenibacillus sp. P26]|nr:GNAT family N-acetyltransferase [Paenibacillus sp. P26]